MITEKIFQEAMRFYASRGQDAQMAAPLALQLSGGETGYVIYDRVSESVDLYVGEESRQGYLRWIWLVREEEPGEAGDLKIRLEHEDTPRLELRFRPKKALTKEEAAICQKAAVVSGRRISGDWPVLRRVQPWMLWDEVRDEQELQWMAEALRAVNWYRENSYRSPMSLADVHTMDAEMLEMIPEGKGYRVKYVPMPRGEKRLWPMQQMPAQMEEELARIAALPHAGEWTMHLLCRDPEKKLFSDGSVRPEHLGEGAPTELLMGKNGSVRTWSVEVTDFAENPAHLLQVLDQYLQGEGVVPAKVTAMDERTQMFLSQWCGRSGVKLQRVSVREMDEFQEAMDSGDFQRELQQRMAQEAAEEGPEGGELTRELKKQAALMEERLRKMPPEEIAQMPEELFSGVQLYDQLGLFSSETSEKLRSAMRMRALSDPFSGEDWDEDDDRREQEDFAWDGDDEDWEEDEEDSCSYALVLQVMAGRKVSRKLVVNADEFLDALDEFIRKIFGLDDDPEGDVFYLNDRVDDPQESLPVVGGDGDQTGMDYLVGEKVSAGGRFALVCADGDRKWVFHCRVMGIQEEQVPEMTVLQVKGKLADLLEKADAPAQKAPAKSGRGSKGRKKKKR